MVDVGKSLNKLKKDLKLDMKSYKGAPTNENKGFKTHGKFANSGQKKGKKAIDGKGKVAKSDPVQAKLRKISKSMFHRPKTLNGDVSMRAQLNA